MILGVGVDLCKIERVREAMERTGEPFLRKIFTEKEIDLASKTSDVAAYFAARFAAKEAIFKALQIGLFKYEGTDIEISAGELGEPIVSLSGNLAEFATRKGVRRVLVSMSYDGEYAVAVSVLEG